MPRQFSSPAGEVLSGGGGVPTENESCNKVIESRRETVAGWFQGRRKWKAVEELLFYRRSV